MATMVGTSTMTTSLLQEFRNEAVITKRILECVPAHKLTWKPHPKSMSLGQLAGHIASIPGRISKLVQQESFDVLKGSFVPAQPASLAEILTTLEQGVGEADQFLQGFNEESAAATFRLLKGDRELFRQPRAVTVRTIMLNHWYHHRGQLSVYLRLLEVPLPVIYGRSADTDPFA